MNIAFIHLSISQTLLHRLHTLPEQIHVQFLESCSCNRGVEVDPLVKRIDFDGGLSGGRKSPLSSFTGSSQPPQSSWIPTDILLVLSFKLLNKVVNHPVIKILTSQMRVSGSRLHLEYTFLNCKQRDIKSATTQVENQDVLLAHTGRLLVQPIRNSSRSGLVDDSHDIKPRDDTCVLGGLALGVVEVGRDGDHRVFYGGAEVGFGDFFHLVQHHGGYFFSRELFLFAFV
ncbi:putative glutamate dehydrogenase, NAD-specific [Helianthus annuus]|nr:putative glutamate dehydrogenase, NAD-specific [Helianthus annuus]